MKKLTFLVSGFFLTSILINLSWGFSYASNEAAQKPEKTSSYLEYAAETLVEKLLNNEFATKKSFITKK